MVSLNKLPSAPPASHTHSHDTDLTGVSANDHHNQAHAIDGGDHTGSLGHAALSGVSSDQHHTQAHAIDGGDHTGSLAHTALSGVSADQHHTESHAARHAENAADELLVEGLGTAETDTDLVLKPDGTGGVAFGEGGGGISAHALLDGGTAHSDTAADTVSRGSLVVGNSTPAWDELVLGATGTIPASDGTDLAYKTPEILHIITFTGLAEDLASGVLMPRPGVCVGESGEHGTYTGIRGKAIAGTAGTGTNTILIEADDNPAFSSAVTLFTLALNTSTEVDDTTLDTAWATGDIFIRARCTAVGATPPKDVTVFFYYQEALLLS